MTAQQSHNEELARDDNPAPVFWLDRPREMDVTTIFARPQPPPEPSERTPKTGLLLQRMNEMRPDRMSVRAGQPVAPQVQQPAFQRGPAPEPPLVPASTAPATHYAQPPAPPVFYAPPPVHPASALAELSNDYAPQSELAVHARVTPCAPPAAAGGLPPLHGPAATTQRPQQRDGELVFSVVDGAFARPPRAVDVASEADVVLLHRAPNDWWCENHEEFRKLGFDVWDVCGGEVEYLGAINVAVCVRRELLGRDLEMEQGPVVLERSWMARFRHRKSGKSVLVGLVRYAHPSEVESFRTYLCHQPRADFLVVFEECSVDPSLLQKKVNGLETTFNLGFGPEVALLLNKGCSDLHDSGADVDEFKLLRLHVVK